jgi:hypothetical protein
MNRNQGNRGSWGRLLRGGILLSLLGLSVALLAELTASPTAPVTGNAVTGWGAEASTAVAEGLTQISPISLANACGMGASSCFRCHNGKRAAAPNMDAAKAPWHKQHAKVNNSCVGCHKGNARIMKEDLAHAKMLAKPRDNTADACASCHSSDLAKVQGAYHANAGAK